MRGLRSIASIVLALVLIAGTTIHGACAAGMAMPTPAAAASADMVAGCGLCASPTGTKAAAQCALVCAGLTGVLGPAAAFHAYNGDRPVLGAQATSIGRFAAPEPDPPR